MNLINLIMGIILVVINGAVLLPTLLYQMVATGDPVTLVGIMGSVVALGCGVQIVLKERDR